MAALIGMLAVCAQLSELISGDLSNYRLMKYRLLYFHVISLQNILCLRLNKLSVHLTACCTCLSSRSFSVFQSSPASMDLGFRLGLGVNLEPILGSLDTRHEYTLDGMQGYDAHTHTNTHTRSHLGPTISA